MAAQRMGRCLVAATLLTVVRLLPCACFGHRPSLWRHRGWCRRLSSLERCDWTRRYQWVEQIA